MTLTVKSINVTMDVAIETALIGSIGMIRTDGGLRDGLISARPEPVFI